MLRLTHPKILLKVNLKTLPNLTLGLILLAYVMNVSMVLSRGQSWGDDFAAYIMQAKSIVTGTENSYFEQNSFTIQNSSSVIGPVAYPWGYPLFLSMFYVVFGLNLLALKIPNILFFILFLIVFYRLLKWRLPPWESILLVSILAFNPSLLSFQNNILSDIPFLFLSTLSVILIDRFVCKNKNIPITGIILLVTLLGCQIINFWQQRKRIIKRSQILLIYFIPYFVFACLWIVFALILPRGESSYFLSFSSPSYAFLPSLKYNLQYYYHLMEEFLVSLPSIKILYGFLLAFLLIGIISGSEEEYAILLYSSLMVGYLLVWPVPQGLRFIFPIIPFFVYFSFQGMKTGFSCINKNYRKVGSAITYVFWIAMLIMFVIYSINLAKSNLDSNRQQSGPFVPSSIEMFKYIQTNTPSNSIIVFFKPRAMHLMTDRNAIMIKTCGELNHENYIVLIKEDEWNQIPIDRIGSCDLITDQIFTNENFVIYRLKQ
jgi:hypothetical protein